MAISTRLSFFVLFAVVCVAVAHPVRPASKLFKGTVRTGSKLRTSVKTNAHALSKGDAQKRKINSVVR
eukprot:IDg3693t1